MRMARELKGYTHFLGDAQIMWTVSQQDAGGTRAVTVTVATISQERTKAFRSRQGMVGHANELQIIHDYFLIEQGTNAAALKGLGILTGMRKLLVIAGDEEFTERRRQIHPRRGQVLRLNSGAIV